MLKLRALLGSDSGATAVEYGLSTAFVSVVTLAAVGASLPSPFDILGAGWDAALAAPALVLMSAAVYVLLAHLDDLFDERYFDRRYNVQTAGRIRLDGLDLESPNRAHGNDYVPTPVRTLRGILHALGPELDGLVFVDFGSGKGRALLVAAEFAVNRIVGVEFSPELNDIARRNIATYDNAGRRCFDIDTCCMDAADFEIPDERCVLYFFNPFKRSIMAEIAANVRRSYERNPRKIFIVYYHPRCADVFQGLEFLRKRRTARLNTDVFTVLESVA